MNNTYIQAKADGLLTDQLRDLFVTKSFELGEFEANQKFEKGIDFFFEVFNKNKQHEFLFLNQNKGTLNNLKIITTKSNVNFDKITFQISIRHAEYFYFELEEPIIFTLCDIKGQKVYWYDIQNDTTIPEKISKQKENNKNSIQIFISQENTLCQKSFDRFVDAIDYAKYNQRRKKGISENLIADYSLTNLQDSDADIIDKISHTLDLFEGIKVLPVDVISKLHPFKGTDDKTGISNLSLRTDNEEFFNFMSSIVSSNGVLKISDNKLSINSLKTPTDISEKLRDIINFFQSNQIYHIRWSGKNFKNQICVHLLFHYEMCTCERCNLERLNFVRTKELSNTNTYNSTYELLRKGYTYYLLGDYYESFKVFYNIYLDADKKLQPINYTIAKYNLLRLKVFIKSFYFEGDRVDILEKLERIKFINDERFITQFAPYFLDIYKNLKDMKFYDDVIESVDDSFTQIQKIYYRDKNGGSDSITAYEKMQASFLRFNSYLDHNFIIFNNYKEYGILAKKIVESLLILHSLKNPESRKYEIFEWYALTLWIFHIEESFMDYLLNKYEISEIKISNSTISNMEGLLENLFLSSAELSSHTGLSKPIRLGRILNNIFVILQLVNVSTKKKEEIIDKCLNNSKLLLDNNIFPFDGLYFYAIKSEPLKKAVFKRVVNTFISKSNLRYKYTPLFEKYYKKCTAKELEDLIKKILKTKDLKAIETKHENFDEILYAISLLPKEKKDEIKNNFKNKLYSDFDAQLYLDVTLYDIIDFDELLYENYVSQIVDMSNFDEVKFPFHSFQNLDLYNLMSIIFKFDLKIDDQIRNQINKLHPKERDYFDWLMNIDNYNYSKFQAYWILKSQTKYLKARFKKSKKLKLEIAKSLKIDYVEGVAKFYFKNLL